MLDYRTETFLTVCKTLNFTTAAKQLNITQPAVSQHIHFLSKKKSKNLIIRINMGILSNRKQKIKEFYH